MTRLIETVNKNQKTKVEINNDFVKGALIESEYDNRTLNGMKTRSTSGSVLLDFFGIIGSMRNENVIPYFEKCFEENSLLALKLALYTRDIRCGQGNRKNFRDILYYITNKYPYNEYKELTKINSYIINFIKKIPEIGRWDDLFYVDSSYKSLVFKIIEKGLNNDETKGLCAKWLPRQKGIANELRKYLKLSPKQYRKKLVSLTNIVEQKMCDNKWEDIEYNKIPSKAFKKYTKAFSRHDFERFESFLASVLVGKNKINAGAIYPYDIIANLDNNKIAAEGQWKNLPNYINKNINMLVMIDGSSSMWRPISKNIYAMHIAQSLAIYTAERLNSSFKNLCLTFSEHPKFIKLSGSLYDKVMELRKHAEVSNTNIISAFRLILDNAKRYNVKQEDMPTHLLILSDMQFDYCANFDDSVMQSVQRQYKDAGYDVPKIIFWYISVLKTTSPISINDKNVALVSGFSPSILKYICEDKLNPMEIMYDVLKQERYNIED